MASGWPRFADGDVEIRLSDSVDGHFTLHGYVLALHSPFFKASLSKQWSEGREITTSCSPSTPNVRAVYELRFDSDDTLGMLSRENHAPDQTAMLPATVEDTNESPSQAERDSKRLESLQAHRNLLRAFYYMSPSVDASNFSTASSAILALMAVADMYGCGHVAAVHLDGCLRQHTSHILARCESDPVDMLSFANSIRSAWIFQEAASHLLGRSKRYYDGNKARLATMGISDLLDKKRAEFVNKLVATEHRLLAQRPSLIASSQDALAQAFFQHWLSDRLEKGEGSKLGPGYASVYHDICEPNISTTAIWKTRVQRWLGLAGMPTVKAESYILARVGEVLEQAATVVRPLCEDATLRRKDQSDKFRALTCMTIHESELPWNV